ncbi:MAG: cytidylate kinase-like family protein [Syntrophus sp. (in: bacteria)]|nr:cytidylate kinase-like family protein [Syntrophus sp. (in: bacteria)]
MKKETRSLDQLVSAQLARWHTRQAAQKKMEEEKPKPCLTISIDPGSGGVEIAKRLASLLGMDLLGSEIIQRIAESSEKSEEAVKSLDEKETSKLNSWLSSLFATQHLTPDEYLRHLTRVVGAIGKYGNAMLLGRGAQYILPRETTFRARIIAPLDVRIEKAVQARKQSRKDAEDFVLKMEYDRRSFVEQYFHRDVTNPLDYDLVLNTENLSIDAAVATLETAFKAKFQGM